MRYLLTAIIAFTATNAGAWCVKWETTCDSNGKCVTTCVEEEHEGGRP